MSEPIDSSGAALEAGAFGVWLAAMRQALAAVADADVPCGDCSACCSTSHFVHIGPEELDTLERVPRELLFPAPGLPAGHVLLPYDERGRCPMLAEDGRCSVYEHRPLTCRTYDCRVFAAAGLEADREPITQQARRWRFSCPAPDDSARLDAVRAAACWVPAHAAAFPGGHVPEDPAELAVLAVRVADVFLPDGPACEGADDVAVAAAVIRAAAEGGRGGAPAAGPAAAYRGRRP